MLVGGMYAERLLPITMLVAALLVLGCAANPVQDFRILTTSSKGLTDDEARLLDRSKRYAQWRLLGGTIGVAVGCTIGVLVADKDNRTAACIIGGAGVGVAAYNASAYIARLNEQAEERRATLEGQLAAAEATLAETRDVAAISRRMVEDERQRIARLNEEYRAGRIQKDAYDDEVKVLSRRLEVLNGSIQVAEDDVKAMELVVERHRSEQRDPARLELEVRRMKAEVERLRTARERLIAAIGTIPPEIDKPDVPTA